MISNAWVLKAFSIPIGSSNILLQFYFAFYHAGCLDQLLSGNFG